MITVNKRIGWLPVGAKFKLENGIGELTSVKPLLFKFTDQNGEVKENRQASENWVVELVHPKYEYPSDSSEYMIQEVLTDLIDKAKEKMYTAEFKKSSDFNTQKCDLETLGAIISKFTRWEPTEIELISIAAFEDSNCSVEINEIAKSSGYHMD